MEARIREEMFNLGILSNKRGYIYIIEAVKRFNSSITMEEIYNSIASTVGKSRCAVERSIRTAIKSAKMDAGDLKDYAVGSRDASTVTWVESHDTYTREESTSLTDEDIKLGWAFLAARENGNALFFARTICGAR